MRSLTRLIVFVALLAPALAGAQEPVRDSSAQRARGGDSAAVAPTPDIGGPGVRFIYTREPLRLAVPAPLGAAGRMSPRTLPADALAESRAQALQEQSRARLDALWGQRTSAQFALVAPPAGSELRPPVQQPQLEDPAMAAQRAGQEGAAAAAQRAGVPADLFGDYADLGLNLSARLEAKAERNKNERCTASQIFISTSNCQGSFQPQFDFQFGVRTGGVVADRIHVNVDYDSQREFDASNNISIYYEGKSDELLQRLEVGNVSFQPPASRFITGGIPSGNYGLQAIGQLGPMQFRTIMAQQKGNVIKDRVYTVGDRTVQGIDRSVEDYQVEARRFFWTVDPTRLPGYPNIDILDDGALAAAAASLPVDQRPTRVFLYRLQFNSQPFDPRGPQFIVRGLADTTRGQIYQRLQEGVDYYIDPSQLWISLVRPLTLNQERLVVAYEVGQGQRSDSGGTPDLSFTEASQYANLIWDPSVRPTDPVFSREIRSVYRVGGEDIIRNTIAIKIVAGNSGELEKPLGGTAQTFLEMFGLAQRSNASAFDLENRLFPRPTDPNVNPLGGTNSKTIRDYFLVFPSLRPFASDGLVDQGNPANDTLYTTPVEDLYSTRRPQTIYQIRATYQAMGGGEGGSLMLGAVQVRQNSERIMLDGRQLVRGTDYTVDYELGRVTFMGADTLFRNPRQVSVQYEENPLFAEAPTSIFGLAASFPMQNGTVNFTAISQSQRTTFNRPPLGFEPASSLVAGVSGTFNFEAEALSRALERLPFVGTTTLSRIDVQGELATSRPQPNSAGRAYVESFEGEGGITIPLFDNAWYYSSQPVATPNLSAFVLDTAYASTLVWQTNPVAASGLLQFRIDQIDPYVRTEGQGLLSPEQMLWLSLFPLGRMGFQGTSGWLDNSPPPLIPGKRRWRSIRTPLSSTGIDLSRVEEIEFWTYIDIRDGNRALNPRLVFDFGDISENTLAFKPDTMYIRPRAGGGVDTSYAGKTIQNFDTLDTERDPFTRAFNAAQDDVGLPGDLIDRLVVVDLVGANGTAIEVDSVPICQAQPGVFFGLGDTDANCTVRNSRLDEEDLDIDGALDLPSAVRGQESILRYIVDLAGVTWDRRGVCNESTDSTGRVNQRCWVHYRIPFNAPTDSNNSPLVRRIKSLRLTIVAAEGDTGYTQLPIARLKLVGSPWVKRADEVISGIAGERPAGSHIAATIVSTTDSASLGYVPPPGVIEGLDSKTGELTTTGPIQVNEKSLRLLAGSLDLHERAEAYLRFPEGQKSFMGYKEMRLWARGRGNGWGEQGELQFFVKIGRDANNFYLYRTPVNEGDGIAPWLPEVQVDFAKLYALRARIQNAFLQNTDSVSGCTAVDSAIIAASERRTGTRRYVACDGPYMAYTVDPNTSAPNLGAVQELAVGMIRISDTGTGTGAVSATDTLELWVDDIRLTDVEDTPGYAGQLGVNIHAGDIGSLRFNVSRQDPHFRQLAEQPTFLTNDQFDMGASVRLDRLLPASLGLSLPFTISHSRRGVDPLFLARSDLRGEGIEGLRTPKSSATSMTFGARRTAPLRNPYLGPIVNYLGVSGSVASGEDRSEYREGQASSYRVSLDYTLTGQGAPGRIPGWMDDVVGLLPSWMETLGPVRAFRASDFRLTPTQFRLTSEMARTTNRALTFLKPAEVTDGSDAPRIVRGLDHLWRNASLLELRPMTPISLRWDVNSLRDLRDYDRGTPTGIIAGFERDEMLGVDVGLERERQMSASLGFSPQLAVWLRPRVDFGTTFSMLRDPNARSLVREGATPDDTASGELRLPRRLNNSQNFSAGLQFDLGRALITWGADSGLVRRLADVFLPVDLSYARSLSSAYDGVAFDAPLAYQFALGGVDDFREVRGVLAASAGRTNNLQLSNSLALPLNLSVMNRFVRTESRLWTRRVATRTQTYQDNQSTTFPDVSLRWTFRPAFLRDVIGSVGANVGGSHTEERGFRPAEVAGQGAEVSRRETWRYPASMSVVWAFGGGFATNAGMNLSKSEAIALGGTTNLSRTRDMNVDVSRRIKLPESWGFENDFQTRLGFQRSQTRSSVLEPLTNLDRSLTNSGRYAINLNADTDLGEDLMFSLTASRIVSYDNQYDRRFTQTIISAVLTLQFFAGELGVGGR